MFEKRRYSGLEFKILYDFGRLARSKFHVYFDMSETVKDVYCVYWWQQLTTEVEYI